MVSKQRHIRQFEAVQCAFESVSMTPAKWRQKSYGGLKNKYSDNASKKYAIIYTLKWELRLTHESLAYILGVSTFMVSKAIQFVVDEMSFGDEKRCEEIKEYIKQIENNLKQLKEQ